MSDAEPPAVELRGLFKSFGGVPAIANVSLRVRRGALHGIVGENGAGKTTAMKILFGMLKPDRGEILLHGTSRAWDSPAHAMAHGLGMVHQHFMLAGPFTALDNVLLSSTDGPPGYLDRRRGRRELEALARTHGLPVDWDRTVESLPVGVQQRIEILKLLYRQADILILDEPTAVLTPQETESLFSNLRALREQGRTVILITHKLREIAAWTDQVTVFRRGEVVGDFETRETNPQQLADLMVGRAVRLQPALDTPRTKIPPDAGKAVPALEIKGLTVAGPRGGRARLQDARLKVKAGEILGVVGVEGNGQTELVQAVMNPGSCAWSSGQLLILGTPAAHWTTREVRAAGVALIPEDRLASGLLPGRPVTENYLLGLQRSPQYQHRGWLRPAPLRAAVTQAMEDFDVRPRDPDLSAGSFSGGNQQKLIIAREFHKPPKLLLAILPTRGVDVGAIEFIHERIVEARNAGAGVLLISSELDEIQALADRIIVLYEGRIVGEFDRDSVTESQLGLKMGGG